MTAAAVLVGVVAGAALAWILLHHRVDVWARHQLERWQAATGDAIREDSLLRSRAVLHGRASEQLAPVTADFPFDPADARFIGSPVDFVVFDGYRDVRAGMRGTLRRIVLVDVKTGTASLSTVQRRVRDCVAEGLYSWHQVGVEQRARRG
jgi:predicted Holliday junction resolvase-like endonuclease